MFSPFYKTRRHNWKLKVLNKLFLIFAYQRNQYNQFQNSFFQNEIIDFSSKVL